MTTVEFSAIHDHAHELFQFIHAEMTHLDHMTDPRWIELHELAQLAGLIASRAGRLASDDDPVDFVPVQTAPGVWKIAP